MGRGQARGETGGSSHWWRRGNGSARCCCVRDHGASAAAAALLPGAAAAGRRPGTRDCRAACPTSAVRPSWGPSPPQQPAQPPAAAPAAGPPVVACIDPHLLPRAPHPAHPQGVGLINLGNTCFMNSVLQCLSHTPPLAQLFLSSGDAAPRRGAASGAPSATPGHFHLGRQEDAHEYLRCLVDAMHEAWLKGVGLKQKPSQELATTTFVHRIFGGRLRSQIKCEGVDYESSTYDPFLDLSLEINQASTLQRALQHFTAAEVLDGDNRYRCPKNGKLVRAKKRITIEEAPNVLAVHLKRFDFFGRGARGLSKRVEFGTELDLGPFMSGWPVCGGQQYDLYGVLVHHGHSLHSGHYVCYVKAGNGIWHLCDDHRVAQVSQRAVEGQQAYILFYVRRHPRTPDAIGKGDPAAVKAAMLAMAERKAAKPPAAGPSLDSSGKSKQASAGAGAAAAQQQRAAAPAARLKDAAAAGKASAAGAGGGTVGTSSTESTANAVASPASSGRSQPSA
ncbi:MAG: hypothetical protein J3K34DRAFT_372984 [Monoraphidium minutum]|nr:MAG: hypothetical protein J3K34DRAFT_372984 [Monoraphidium minutum]